MGYRHIENLYKNQSILQFEECYALEKIHGTSAHIAYENDKLRFFSGGEKHDRFVALFDQPKLLEAFRALGHPKVTVYGEAYGGKQQGMRETYGDELRFVAFEVLVEETWLNVPDAADTVTLLGLEFVAYAQVPTTLAALDAERDRPSRQAKRNGIEGDKVSEGVVLRPLTEQYDARGNRIIAKHKNPAFSERASKKDTVVSPEKAVVLAEAEAIANEWVTPMRLQHVLDKLTAALGRLPEPEDTKKVLGAMLEDVFREAKGEIVESKGAVRAINSATSKLFSQVLRARLEDAAGPHTKEVAP